MLPKTQGNSVYSVNDASLVHNRFVAALAQGLAESDGSIIARLAYQNAVLSEPAK